MKLQPMVIVTEIKSGERITKLTSTEFMTALRTSGLAVRNDFVQTGIENYNKAYPELNAELVFKDV